MRRLVSAVVVAVVFTALAIAPAAGQQPPRPKFVPPVKGVAQIGYLKPQTKVVGNDVVTVFKIKNLSNGAIARLQVDEYWWDKENNTVGGDREYLKKPLMPGEVATIELRTPKNAKMHRNTYQFLHANGTVKAKVLQKIE